MSRSCALVSNAEPTVGGDADELVARWASQPIELCGTDFFTPTVAGPSTVPDVTAPSVAESNPELAVLSAVVHGRSKEAVKAARIAAVARAACRASTWIEGVGRAELIRRLLTLRFSSLSADAAAHIAAASVEDLDAIGERSLTAQTLDEALDRR